MERRENYVDWRLLDLQELDIEHQGAVGRNSGLSFAAIRRLGGDSKSTLTTNGHAGNTNIPALNDLALAELECERLAGFVGCTRAISIIS